MKETPVNILSADYWNGHNPLGECTQEKSVEELLNKYALTSSEWLTKSLNPATYMRRITEWWERKTLDNFARETLKAFLEVGSYSPLRRFQNGEIFDGNIYNPGTVIFMEDETLTLLGDVPRYRGDHSYGVVCTSQILSYPNDEDSIVKIYPVKEINGDHLVLLEGARVEDIWLHLPVKMGNVAHFRSTSGYSRLSRHIQIDVLQQGVILPETSQKGVLVPNFNPII